MNILIACSNNWFKLKSDFKKDHFIETVENENQLNLDYLKNFKPDYIFFPHWNWIVPSKIYKNYKCIVFHTAPLPYGRGGSPIQNLILNGFSHSPVCAVKMTKKIDAGPIYAKKNVSLSGSLSKIFIRINKVTNELIYYIIKNGITPVEQDKEGEFVFKRLTSKDNMIPNDTNLRNFYDRVRMLDEPSYPNAFIKYGNLKFEFSEPKFISSEVKLTCKVTKC